MQFTETELKRYYPQWVPTGTGTDAKGNPTGITVKDPDDHMAKAPDHYEEWLTKLNPPPKSEEELNGAVLAEREACIKFVLNYPTGKVLAAQIAKELRKSRSMGGFTRTAPTGSLQQPKGTTKSTTQTQAPEAAGSWGGEVEPVGAAK